jgi:hypothetical protein
MIPLISIYRRRKITDRHKKERTLASYLGIFSLREVRFNKSNKQYPMLNFKTELELVSFLKSAYGNGEYTVLGHLKGRHGGFVFWKGEIRDEGWIFNIKSSFTNQDIKEIEMFKQQLSKVEDYEEEKDIKEEIEFTKSFAKEINKSKRYGFQPWLIASGKRGQINFWDMPSKLVFEDNTILDVPSTPIEIQKLNKKVFTKSQIHVMNLDDVNNNFKD